MVVSSAASTAPSPFGTKPPRSTRRETPETCEPGSRPRIAAPPMARNTRIAIALISANQNSNSP